MDGRIEQNTYCFSRRRHIGATSGDDFALVTDDDPTDPPNVRMRLSRKDASGWHARVGTDNDDEVFAALAAMDEDRRVLILTGCPRCRRVLAVEREDLSDALRAHAITGKTQNLTAYPYSLSLPE